ncbi:MAG: response regulator [Deferrisomatales bacterium]
MKPARILLADDEVLIQLTLAKALRAAGHEVAVAADGTRALERLAAEAFDLVITDLAMDGADGIGVLQAAKERDPDVAVIVITGYCDVASAVAALRSGAEDYLAKPFDFDELLLRATRCLERRELRRKVRLYERMLPVCSGCRKVRDDDGRAPGTGPWLPLEEYLPRRAGVTVSHGMCPECTKAWLARELSTGDR